MAAMDALSEALRGLRLTGGLFLDARFTAPWSVLTCVTPEYWRPVLAEPNHLIAYHFVVEGSLLASVQDGQPIEIRAGEIVLVPHNEPHILASEAGLAPVDAAKVMPLARPGSVSEIDYGGGGEMTRLVCGFLATDAVNPILESLPSVVRVDIRQGSSQEWVESSVRFAASELANGNRPTSNVIVRLSECLLAEAIRHHATAEGQADGGWFRGFSDPQIGRALAAIHRDVAHDWTVEALAGKAALSRSAFTERFASLVGMPPIRYLALARIQAAKLRLQEGGLAVRQVAFACGYDSEEAFSRAFKREVGMPPAKWREQNRGR